MKKRSLVFLVLGLISAVTMGSAAAQTAADVNSNLDSLFGEHVAYEKFFDRLKKAVGSNDKETVASMIDYPFRARIDGKALKIRDAAHFVADYDKIFTAKVKHAIANQSYATLFANWQGVMIGDGEVWFSGVGDNNVIKITAVND